MLALLKWCLRLVFILASILCIISWAIYKVIPAEKRQAIVEEQLEQRLHRQVRFGALHLSWGGLIVDDLRLSEIPNFRAGTALTAKGVRLGWNLRSLWDGLDVKKRTVTSSSGNLHIDQFHNPHYSGQDLSLTWDLTDIDPSWKHLNGTARLEQGKGLLQNVDQLMATSPSAKVALTPVTILMNLDHLGFINLGLPNLEHWPIRSIEGDYLFKDGVMTIRRFDMTGPQLNLMITGAVELASEVIALQAELHSPPEVKRGALNVKMRLTGTVSHPKMDLASLKKNAFKATLTGLLENVQKAIADRR